MTWMNGVEISGQLDQVMMQASKQQAEASARQREGEARDRVMQARQAGGVGMARYSRHEGNIVLGSWYEKRVKSVADLWRGLVCVIRRSQR
jgi:hypothetical protein